MATAEEMYELLQLRQRGTALFEAGRFEEALEVYTLLSIKDQQDSSYHITIAAIQEKLGRHDAAIASYREYLRLNPGNDQVWAALGITYFYAGKTNEAIECCDALVDLNPKDRKLWDFAVKMYGHLGMLEEAEECRKKAITLAPVPAAPPGADISIGTDPDQLIRMGKDFAEKRKYGEAEACLTKAAGLGPGSEDLWTTLGDLFYIMKRYPDAAGCYEKALALRSDKPHILCAAGLAWFETPDREKALTYFEKAAAFDPSAGGYLACLMQMFNILGMPEISGVCKKKIATVKERRERSAGTDTWGTDDPFAKRAESTRLTRSMYWTEVMAAALEPLHNAYGNGGIKEMIRLLEAAYVRFPKNPAFLKMKAGLYQKDGDFEKVNACFQEILRLYPSSPYFWFEWGIFYFQTSDYAGAIRCFDQTLQIDPGHVGAIMNKARSLYNKRCFPEALPVLEQAVALHPSEPEIWREKGKVHYKIGQNEDAVACYEQVLRLLPDDAEAQNAKGFCLRELGRTNEANACFAAAASQKAGREVSLDPPEPEPAQKDPIQFIKKLGKGGFGIVHLVFDHRIHHSFAYKTYRDEYRDNSAIKRNFIREAEIWIQLGAHPNIVRAMGINNIDDRVYIILEYIPPGKNNLNTLEGYLYSEPPEPEETLRWALQICEGMAFVTAKGLSCHRDLKPANIMITSDRTAKITDFGLSAAFNTASSDEQGPLPAAGGILAGSCTGLGDHWAGTPTHMAPEQFMPAIGPCDQRSDIYSVGIILYQMVSRGALPFWPNLPTGPGLEAWKRFTRELARMHLQDPVPYLDSPLFPVIRRCLEKKPASRYQSFRDLKADLETLYRQISSQELLTPQGTRPEIIQWDGIAENLFVLGRYNEALGYFEKVLAVNPHDERAVLMKANCLNQLKRYGEAVTQYDAVLAINADNSMASVNKGIALRQQGRYGDAVVCYEQAVRVAPDIPQAWYEMALCYRELHNLDAAFSSVVRGIAACPDDESLHLLHANILNKDQKKYPEALEAYDRVLQINPANVRALNNKGLCLDTMGRRSEAIGCYEKAIALDPAATDQRINLVQILMREGRTNEALAHCDAELKKDPANKTFAGLKENCLIMFGKKRETPSFALTDVEKRAQEDLLSQASTCRENKQFTEALRLLEEALQHDPRSRRILGMKAALLQMIQRHRDAIACCDEALRVTDDENFLVIKGISLCSLGLTNDALDCYARALDRNPKNIQALTMKGLALESVGRKAEALGCYEAALRLSPGFAGAQEGRERILATGGISKPAAAVPDDTPVEITGVLANDIRKGRQLVLSGEREEAVKWFDGLIAQHSSDDNLWVEKGIAVIGAVKAGNITAYDPAHIYEAIQCFEKAVALNPRCINAFIQQGMLYYEMLDFTEAHASLDKAIAIDPHSVPALKGKAMTFAEAARFSEAVEYCDRCLRLDSTLADVRRLRDKYSAEMKKPGPRPVMTGISFKKQFPESPVTPSQTPAQPPAPNHARPVYNAEIGKFHNRFTGCCREVGRGKLEVDMERVTALVKENPDLARQYIAMCCSEGDMPLRNLQMIGFIGVAIQMQYNDSGPLDMIEKLRREMGRE